MAFTREGENALQKSRRTSTFLPDILTERSSRHHRELNESMTQLSTALEKHRDPTRKARGKKDTEQRR